MTPQDFIARWGPGGPAAHLNEEQGAQSQFLDLCNPPLLVVCDRLQIRIHTQFKGHIGAYRPSENSYSILRIVPRQ